MRGWRGEQWTAVRVGFGEGVSEWTLCHEGLAWLV